MKKFVSLVVVCVVAVVVVSPALAWNVDKFKAGTNRIIQSPRQIKDNVKEEYQAAQFKPFGIIGGTMKGLFYCGKEMGAGLLTVLTFNTDIFDKK